MSQASSNIVMTGHVMQSVVCCDRQSFDVGRLPAQHCALSIHGVRAAVSLSCAVNASTVVVTASLCWSVLAAVGLLIPRPQSNSTLLHHILCVGSGDMSIAPCANIITYGVIQVFRQDILTSNLLHMWNIGFRTSHKLSSQPCCM